MKDISKSDLTNNIPLAALKEGESTKPVTIAGVEFGASASFSTELDVSKTSAHDLAESITYSLEQDYSSSGNLAFEDSVSFPTNLTYTQISGFLWNEVDDPTTTWAAVSDPSTTWSNVADPSTTWTKVDYPK